MNVTNWCAFPDREILVRQWDDELVIYDHQSGDTHLLESLASEIFLHLTAEPISTGAIVDHIADRFDLESDDDLFSEVVSILDNLVSLGMAQEA